MTKLDKHMDEMLEKLSASKPEANPDWEAFYQANSNRIPVKGNKGIVSKSFFRWSLLVVVILIVVVGGYFYLMPDTVIDEGNKVELKADDPVIIQDGADVFEPDQPDATNGQQNMIIVPEAGLAGEDAGTGGIEEIVASPGAAPEQLGKPIIKQPEIIIDEQMLVEPRDSMQSEPVIIKKTVIIKDTIRITQPIKK